MITEFKMDDKMFPVIDRSTCELDSDGFVLNPQDDAIYFWVKGELPDRYVKCDMFSSEYGLVFEGISSGTVDTDSLEFALNDALEDLKFYFEL